LSSVDAPAWGDTALCTGKDSSGGNKAEGADDDADDDAVGEAAGDAAD
jgi:hypothetical protein